LSASVLACAICRTFASSVIACSNSTVRHSALCDFTSHGAATAGTLQCNSANVGTAPDVAWDTALCIGIASNATTANVPHLLNPFLRFIPAISSQNYCCSFAFFIAQ